MVGELHERCLDFGVLSQPSKGLYTQNWSGAGLSNGLLKDHLHFCALLYVFLTFLQRFSAKADNFPSPLFWSVSLCPPASLVLSDILSSFVPIPNHHLWS